MNAIKNLSQQSPNKFHAQIATYPSKPICPLRLSPDFLVARYTHRAASACDRLISLRSCSNSPSNSRTRCRTGTVNNNVGSRWDDARPILSPHLLRRNASRLCRANMQRQRRARFAELKKIHPQMQRALRLQLLLLNKRISLTQCAQRYTRSHAVVIPALESL